MLVVLILLVVVVAVVEVAVEVTVDVAVVVVVAFTATESSGWSPSLPSFCRTRIIPTYDDAQESVLSSHKEDKEVVEVVDVEPAVAPFNSRILRSHAAIHVVALASPVV